MNLQFARGARSRGSIKIDGFAGADLTEESAAQQQIFRSSRPAFARRDRTRRPYTSKPT
jgi:hypothetical protein